MKIKTALIVVILVLLCVVTAQRCSINSRSFNANEGYEAGEVVAQDSTIDPDHFDRGSLIIKVSKGDADAAYKLALHYDKHGLPEAAYHWFGVAMKLGREGLTQEHLDYYEGQIMDEFLPAKK